MVEGVVRQQPPMSLAPESRHLVANDSNLPSPRHFDGCQSNQHSLKLSPDGAFSPSTELKQIQDGIWMFSSSSSSTNA
ncbi:hypothetical protein CUMW_101070, partial [Citrus unshiu]